MSTYWISHEVEAVLKASHAYYAVKKTNAKDRYELALAHSAEMAINRMIRQKPVRVNECPACRRHMMIKHNFCPDCGQALDWQREG